MTPARKSSKTARSKAAARKTADEALRNSEERYRDLFEHSPVGFREEDYSAVKRIVDKLKRRGVRDFRRYFRKHPEKLREAIAAITIIDVNQTVLTLYGAPDKEAFTRAERARRVEQISFYEHELSALAAGETRVEAEVTTKILDGSEVVFRVVTHLPDAHIDTWSRVISTEEDITERKLTEKTLRESEARLRTVLDHSPTKIHIKDLDGRYVLINRQSERLFGVTNEQARGKTTADLFPEDIAKSFSSHDRKVVETGRAIQEEEVWRQDDGVHTYLTVKFPIPDASGNTVAVGAIGTDITDHKRAEEEIHRLSLRNELILNSAGEGIYGLDLEGRTTFINPAAARMIGWDPDDLIGRPQHDILHHSKPDGSPYPREECPIYAAFRDGTVHQVSDEVFWRKDGSSFPVEYMSTPILEDGKPVGAVVVFRDITDLKQREEALRESEDRFKDFAEAAADWFWEMTPDFRFSYVSERLFEVLGVKPENLLGKTRWEVGDIDDPEKWDRHRADLEAHKPFRNFVYSLREVDGTARTLRTSGNPRFDGEGRFLGYRGAGSDITAEIAAIERAEQARARLSDAIESISEGFVIWDAEDRLLLHNRRFHEIRPETVEILVPGVRFEDGMREMARRGIFEPKGEVLEAYLRQRLQRHREPGEPFEQSLKGDRWVQITEQRTSDGGTVGIYTDTTERKRAEDALRESETRVRMVLDNVADCVVTIGENGRIQSFNPAAERVFGYTADEVIGRNVRTLMAEPDRERHGSYIKNYLRTGKGKILGVGPREVTGRRKDGSLVPLELTVSEMVLGEKRMFIGAMRDFTERKWAEKAFRESEARLRSIAANVPGAIFRRVHTPDGTSHYEFLSAAYKELFGHDPKTLMADASTLREVVHPEDFEALQSAIARSVERLEGQDIEFRIVTPEGRITWARSVAQPRRVESGDIVCDGIVLDITDRKEAEERIEYLAYHDQLTGLPNRALFVDRLGQAITAAERGDRSLVVLSLGLDRFSAITDTLGHAAGDEVVKEVAGRLGRCLRDGDTVARATGDTFLILLTALRKAEHATKVLQNIFAALKTPVAYGDRELHVTASIGASVFPADGADGEALLKNADSALHRAKSEAPGGYRFFTADMNAKALARLSLETRLRRAVEMDELVVHYQPQVDLQNGRVIGVEALVRWQPPDQELIPPAEFIALAEETGLIVPLGERVLDIACAQARAWREAGLPALDMAVNVSARQLHDDRLIATVERILADAELSPDRLKLELTESALMGDPEKTARTMAAFREMGIRLAVDDFGTGYSSLSYLSRFPIETLKIDRSFIITMTTDRNNAAIVEAIMSLAHSLEMKVIAEGVDADEQLTYLRAYRCDAIQGYIFSPPVPADEIPRLVEKGFPTLGSRP
ncbi:MAG: PAS domain S-box protein [Proteobacteria bacterium]|nr:PAS domain S-box protein [Pseudomonadota bacterium]